MRRPITALLLAACSPAWAANYATCILDKMPGTQNDVAAQAIYQVCNSKRSLPHRQLRNQAGGVLQKGTQRSSRRHPAMMHSLQIASCC